MPTPYSLVLLLFIGACSPSPMSSQPGPLSTPTPTSRIGATVAPSPHPSGWEEASPVQIPSTPVPTVLPTTGPPNNAYYDRDVIAREARFYGGDALLSPAGTKILLRGSQTQTVQFKNGQTAERTVSEWAWMPANGERQIQPLQPRLSPQDFISHSGRDVAWLDEEHLVYQVSDPKQTTLVKLHVETGAHTRLLAYNGARSHIQVDGGKVYFATWDQGFQRLDVATGQRTPLATPYPDFYTQRLQFQVISADKALFCLQKGPEQAGVYPFQVAQQTYAPLEDCLQIDWRTGQSTPLAFLNQLAYPERKLTLSPGRTWLSNSDQQPQLLSLTGQPNIGLSGPLLAWLDESQILTLVSQGPETFVQQVKIPAATTVAQAQVPAGSQFAGYAASRLFLKHDDRLISLTVPGFIMRTELAQAQALYLVEDPRLLMWTRIQDGDLALFSWHQGQVTAPLLWAADDDFPFNATDAGWLMPGA